MNRPERSLPASSSCMPHRYTAAITSVRIESRCEADAASRPVTTQRSRRRRRADRPPSRRRRPAPLPHRRRRARPPAQVRLAQRLPALPGAARKQLLVLIDNLRPPHRVLRRQLRLPRVLLNDPPRAAAAETAGAAGPAGPARGPAAAEHLRRWGNGRNSSSVDDSRVQGNKSARADGRAGFLARADIIDSIMEPKSGIASSSSPAAPARLPTICSAICCVAAPQSTTKKNERPFQSGLRSQITTQPQMDRRIKMSHKVGITQQIEV